jgi:PAS domain S-box-containing protein
MLGTYVFFRNPRKIVNISFSLFIFSVGLWSLALFIVGVGKDVEILRFAGRMSFFAGALIVCTLLFFTYVFPDISEGLPLKRALLWIFIPGGIMAIAACTPFIMKDVTYVEAEIRPVYGSGILIYAAYCFTCPPWGFYMLARKYVRHPGRFEKVQLKYTFIGFLISTIGILVFALVLPLAGISRYSTPFTPIVTIAATGAVTYAIVRHRLMDLGIVFRNVLIHAGIAVMLSIILLVSLFLINPILNLPPTGAVILAAMFAAILVQPTRRVVETLVDKYYFRGRYDYKAALAEFSFSMTKILDLEDLQRRIVDEVASMLQVKSAALLLSGPSGGKYTVRASIPVAPGDSNGGMETDNAVVERIRGERSLLFKEELKRLLPRSEFAPLEREFKRMGAEVFIPLIYRGELIGLLALGEKLFADIYSSEDLNLLATLGNQAAVALENALLHHKVTMLVNHNENILKHMSSGLIATDRKQVISTCNDKAREILRLPPMDVIGQEMGILPPPLQEMLLRTLDGKAAYSNHEVEILSDHNAVAYLNAATSLLKDESGNMTGALLMFNDLTEIKLLESEMWRADKLASIGTLAAGMAHEIKNPLVSIKTFAQLLPTKYEDKEFRDTFSAITVDEVERINSIVEKLLEFARPSAPMFESVDIIVIIKEVLLLLTPEFTKHGVIVSESFETPSAPIVGDKGQIKQALLNLCLNGMQAMQGIQNGATKKLSITVGFRKRRHRAPAGSAIDGIAQMFYGTEMPASAEDAETLVIAVRDSGKGIDRKELARIFDPFFTTREQGLGLGLAVVHGIVKEHSGNISVDSEENAGAEFTISLPVRQLFVKEKT